ncbi:MULTISPECIES: thioredoxin family protein [unclassified Polaribacter]|uniref:thioredoxin family protein n=1 Tax=unclassified Polaribacter TaxID=196858 RepID=UPI0011BFA619|nr:MULTISPECIES: thioredoxin family protein [unclassified Polaribacter]TXD52658.1 thioredoxin family protein [Polaribacter sp. IC063]TXD60627.1 thioredoxin family protein [Polaribacter sp. IC066]
MKNILFFFSLILFTACNSNKNAVKSKTTETTQAIIKEVKQPPRIITAKKNTDGYLIGIANKESFSDDSFKTWFNSRYSEYNTDKETIGKLTEALKGYTIKGFMATWCGDSRRETPRFYKILDETGFDQNNFELITVNKSKRTPDNLQEGFNLIRVPTFIFYKNGKEVGRYVEYPRETIEKDILKIVTEQPYKHSYDKS